MSSVVSSTTGATPGGSQFPARLQLSAVCARRTVRPRTYGEERRWT